MEYLLEQDKPLVSEDELEDVMSCSHEEWLKYTDKVGVLIICRLLDSSALAGYSQLNSGQSRHRGIRTVLFGTFNVRTGQS